MNPQKELKIERRKLEGILRIGLVSNEVIEARIRSYTYAHGEDEWVIAYTKKYVEKRK